MKTPAYFRARLALIDDYIRVVPDNGQKNNDHVLLRNGLMPATLLHGKSETAAVDEKLKAGKYSNEPLTFSEKCKWNTWFAMHPEKVAGTEMVTTSIQFPITIKGSKEDIINVLTPVVPDTEAKEKQPKETMGNNIRELKKNGIDLSFLEKPLPSRLPKKADKVDASALLKGEIDVKPIDKKVRPKTDKEVLSEFVYKGRSSIPALIGIHYDAKNEVMVATDAHIMGIFPKKGIKETKTIDPKTGKELTSKYAPYRDVIPINIRGINVDKSLLDKAKGVERANRFLVDEPSSRIAIRISYDGKEIFLDPSYVAKAMEALYSTGTKKIRMELPEKGDKAVIFKDAKNEEKLVLVMPVMPPEKYKTVYEGDAYFSDEKIVRNKIKQLERDGTFSERLYEKWLKKAQKLNDEDGIEINKEKLAEAKKEKQDEIKRLKQNLEQLKKPSPDKTLPIRIAKAKAIAMLKEKQLWEMTTKEVLESIRVKGRKISVNPNTMYIGKGSLTDPGEMKIKGIPAKELPNWEDVLFQHSESIHEALKQGKPVPEKVLKDFPYLMVKVKAEAKKVKIPKKEFLDNLHPLDLWKHYKDRWYRKFQFSAKDKENYRYIADQAIKERITDRKDGGFDIILSVRTDGEADKISEDYMKILKLKKPTTNKTLRIRIAKAKAIAMLKLLELEEEK